MRRRENFNRSTKVEAGSIHSAMCHKSEVVWIALWPWSCDWACTNLPGWGRGEAEDIGLACGVLSNAAAVLTLLSSPLQVRSLTSARGKGASGVLHGATSSQGITESTRVQSPLNATIVTGNAASYCGVQAKCGPREWRGAARPLAAWPLHVLCPSSLVPQLKEGTKKDVGLGTSLTETCPGLLWAQGSIRRAAYLNTP